ncbi:MAG: SET domain-containing protein-lysine N-methyltransferase [Rivularia sp. (in: cyanobacteria)]
MTNNQVKSTNLFTVFSDDRALIKYNVSSFAEIWEDKETSAKSLHSTNKFSPGDIITQIKITKYVDRPSYLSVQIDEAKHIMLKPEYLQYINHSCDPNVFFDTKNMQIVCLKPIEVGEAMTFFYPSTEWSMTQQFDCLCGSAKCLKKIQGAAYLSPDIYKIYNLNEHITNKIDMNSNLAV